MPNHVHNTLVVEDKYAAKLESLISVNSDGYDGAGLFQSVHPMPESLDITSPQHKDVDKEIGDENKAKYGYRDWYAWRTADENWGTKWGDYEGYYDGDNYSFNTAWSPPSEAFLLKLAQIIPNFEIYFEEEQGWGGHYVFENGEITDEHFFDIPDWQETEDDEVWELKEDFVGPEREVYKAGYYAYGSLHEFMGTDWEEVKKEIY